MNPEQEQEEPFVLNAPVEPVLTPSEKEIRDKYVSEYLFDHDYIGAATRIGFAQDVASEYGRRFYYDPYVQRRIAEAMQAVPHDSDAVAEQEKRLILSSLLREANYKGHGASHGARVAALGKLSTIHGMEAPTRTEVKHEGKIDANLSHEFDFENMDPKQLELVRALLEGVVPDGD